jgi:hypothetical protein
MRSIEWKIVLTDTNQIATVENAVGFPNDKIESHLTIIGLLENIKQKHLDKMKTLFEKTVKRGEDYK